MQQILPAFSRSFPYPITRLEPDADGDYLALELLSPEQEVIFVRWHLPTNSLSSTEAQPVYCRLAGCNRGQLLVQSYHQLDKPQAPDFLVLDSELSEIYRQPATSLRQQVPGWLNLKDTADPDSPRNFWLALEELEEGSPPKRDAEPLLQLPMVYSEGSEHFELVGKFVEQQLGDKIRIQAEYLAVFGKILISYYTEVGKLFQWHFSVFTEQGELLGKNKAEKVESASGTTTFMVWKAFIITLPTANSLVGYDLKAEGV